MKKNSKLFKPVGDFSNLDEFVSLCLSALTQMCHLVIYSAEGIIDVVRYYRQICFLIALPNKKFKIT